MDKIRDYAHEQRLRNKRKIRFVFELDITKGKELKEYLNKNNLTLIQWVKNQLKELEI
jgi:hypothetical protein